MTEFGFDIEEVARLLEIADSRQLSEIILEDGDRRIVVRRGTRGNHVYDGDVTRTAWNTMADSHTSSEAVLEKENLIVIASPMVGVFYRASRPEDTPFVEVGDEVSIGQTIGLIEAMKVFSEIPSEVAGIVSKIAVENGSLVKSGEPIMYLAPLP